MNKFVIPTVLGAMLAMPVYAQTATTTTTETPAATTPATSTFGYVGVAGDMSAETFLGKRLYVAEADVDATAQYNEVDEGWDDIGEINDLVLSADGQVRAVLLDIGGFLGIGEREVAVSMDQLRVIRDGDSEDDYFIVFTSDKAALEAAPEYEWVND